MNAGTPESLNTSPLMSAHLNIDASTFAATYGITLGTGAEAESATATTTVAINELLDSATAAVNAVAPIHHAELRTQVDGEGPASLTLTAATIATPATLTVISSEVTEAPNTRCRFSIQAHGDLDFADSAGVQSSVGAEPTISDLEITSVAYSIAESVRRSVTIENKVLVGSAGTPAALDAVLEGLLSELARDEEKLIGLIARSGLETHLWEEVRALYGYEEKAPSVTGLAQALFWGTYLMELDEPSALTQEALVLMGRWRHDTRSDWRSQVVRAAWDRESLSKTMTRSVSPPARIDWTRRSVSSTWSRIGTAAIRNRPSTVTPAAPPSARPAGRGPS